MMLSLSRATIPFAPQPEFQSLRRVELAVTVPRPGTYRILTDRVSDEDAKRLIAEGRAVVWVPDYKYWVVTRLVGPDGEVHWLEGPRPAAAAE